MLRNDSISMSVVKDEVSHQMSAEMPNRSRRDRRWFFRMILWTSCARFGVETYVSGCSQSTVHRGNKSLSETCEGNGSPLSLSSQTGTRGGEVMESTLCCVTHPTPLNQLTHDKWAATTNMEHLKIEKMTSKD